MDPYFYLILGIASACGIAFVVSTRGILYHTPNTDNEIMTYAAAQSGKWRWFSDMHRYGMKTYMKDMIVILIAILQRIMRDKESDHPYTALGGLAICISAVLVYLIGTDYWGSAIGLLISLLYLFSFWPWQTALYGGHVNVAGMFFLLAVYFVQSSTVNFLIYLLLAGISICCMMFSSGSSRKFLGPFFASLFYAQYHIPIKAHDYGNLYSLLPFHKLITWDLIIIVFFAILLSAVFLTYKKIVTKMYLNKCPSFLRGIIENQKTLNLQHYLDHAGKKLRIYTRTSIKSLAVFMFIVNILGINYLFMILGGFIMMFFALTMPHPKDSMRKYFYYTFHNQYKKHFRHYIDYFAKRGITVYRDTRGAGWPWVPRLLWRFLPWHSALFAAFFAYILIVRLLQHQYNLLPLDLTVLIISLLPLLWSEFTKAAQVSRIYAPVFTASIIFIGYSFYTFSESTYFLPLIFGFTILTISWNLWKFLYETYPARMGSTRMFKTLKRLNIQEIYTYNTAYNNSMVYTMPGIKESPYVPRKKIAPPFNVRYIDSMADVKDGWIVIPGTNGIAITMDDEPEAINGNFRFTKDPVLNKLLNSKDIDNIATAKFKTYGTSRAWASECEVLSYMDLILHDITKDALYRGHTWLIHSDKLKSKI